MKLDDGTEKILTFNLPLPFTIVGPLLTAIGETLEREGWTDVMQHQEGYVLATPPKRDAE